MVTSTTLRPKDLNGYQTHGACLCKLHMQCTRYIVSFSARVQVQYTRSNIARILFVCCAEGVTESAAAALYKKKKTPPAPSGRYGASSVVYNDQLWMFGGTDGGFSKHGNGGYELGEAGYTPHDAYLTNELFFSA